MTTSDLAAGYELAYTEARRALEDQERVATDLRGRAAVLIAAAAVVTSFFGTRVADDAALTLPAWIAVACFGLVGAVVLAILWPRAEWQFTAAPAVMIGHLLERPGGPPSKTVLHRELAAHMNHGLSVNHRQLGALTGWMRAGAVLLVGEVIAWIVTMAMAP